jgi:hypothetical protein
MAPSARPEQSLDRWRSAGHSGCMAPCAAPGVSHAIGGNKVNIDIDKAKAGVL